MRLSRSLVLFGLIFIVFLAPIFARFFNYYQIIFILYIPFCVGLIQGASCQIGFRWLFYFCTIFLAGVAGINFAESIKYILLFISISLLSDMAKKGKDFRVTIIKWFFILSVFQTSIVLMQYLSPGIINPLIPLFADVDVAERAIQANLLGGVCIGFAGEAGFAMFYTSMTFFLGYIFYLVENKKRYLIFVIVGLVCTLLTGKRIAIAINIISAIICYYLMVRSHKIKKRNNIIPILLLALIGTIILNYTHLADIILEKNEVLLENGDISNGRAELNAKMISIFKDNMLLGIGPFCTSQYSNEYLGHNIYLTTLSECGILGLTALIILLLLNFKDAILRFKNGDNNIYMFMSIYTQLFFIIYGFTGNPLYGTQFLTAYILFSINENRNYHIPSCK